MYFKVLSMERTPEAFGAQADVVAHTICLALHGMGASRHASDDCSSDHCLASLVMTTRPKPNAFHQGTGRWDTHAVRLQKVHSADEVFAHSLLISEQQLHRIHAQPSSMMAEGLGSRCLGKQLCPKNKEQYMPRLNEQI